MRVHSAREKSGRCVPVPVVLLRLVMLGRVLGLCGSLAGQSYECSLVNGNVLAMATVLVVELNVREGGVNWPGDLVVRVRPKRV